MLNCLHLQVGAWLTLHSQFAILQVFLSAGEEFCKLEHTKDDLSDLVIRLDRTKIESHGRPAINAFLQKLQIYKATANFKAGTDLYEGITTVNEWYAQKLRPEVLRQAKPRKVFVQANTFKEGDNIVLKEYEPTPEGMIQSFVERDYI
jgi:dipeptidyl-peptidase-3